jgi:hypothetical protein
MFDHIAPDIFWPAFFAFWLVIGLACAYAFGKVVDRMNPRANRGEYRHMASVDQVRRESRS